MGFRQPFVVDLLRPSTSGNFEFVDLHFAVFVFEAALCIPRGILILCGVHACFVHKCSSQVHFAVFVYEAAIYSTSFAAV